VIIIDGEQNHKLHKVIFVDGFNVCWENEGSSTGDVHDHQPMWILNSEVENNFTTSLVLDKPKCWIEYAIGVLKTWAMTFGEWEFDCRH
jgi:hypothetical protein